MPIFATEMAKRFTDTEEVLRMINQRLRKLEKSDSEKTEEIGRLNRIIGQKDKEIHSLKMDLASTRSELADAKAHIEELEENAGEHQSSDDDEDNSSGTSGKPEKNSSNSSVPPSQESIAARELRRTKSLRKPSGKPSGGQPGHKGSTLKSVATPDRIIEHKPHYCKCCGRPLSVGFRKIRTTQVIDIKFIVETSEHQYYEKVCQCGCVNNCDAPNCRIKYGDNIRALVTYLNVVQCIPFKRIAELISDLCGQKISEGTVQNILKENSTKADAAYEEIRKRIECAPVVGADETGAAVGKELHWNWIFQNDLLTYVYQMKSRGQQAIDSKFPNGLPNSTLVTDRHRSYFNMNVKDHQVCLAHLLRNAEYLNELDTKQDWSRRFIHLIAHAIDLRRAGDITKRKIKVLKTKMKNLLGESLTHLDEEFESFKKGILKVKDYLFTFLTDLHVPYENNASERGVRKIKVKQKVSGCFRTDGGANDFAKIHSIAETAMKNGNSKFNAILAVVQQ
jgi:transposase